MATHRAFLLVLCGLTGGIGTAQEQRPALYVGEYDVNYTQGRVYRYTWAGLGYTRSLVWSFPGNQGIPIGSLLLDIDNDTLLACSNGGSVVTGISPSGQVLWTFLSPFVQQFMSVPAIDQSGELVAVGGAWGDTHRLCRIDRVGRVLSTIATYTGLSPPGWITVDLESGDYIVTGRSGLPPAGFRITDSGQVSTVTGLETTEVYFHGPLEVDYKYGGYLANTASGPPFLTNGWKRIALQPRYTEVVLLRTIMAIPHGIVVSQASRMFGVLPYVGGTNPGVQEMSIYGGAAQSHAVTPSNTLAFGTAGPPVIVGRRKLTGRGPGTPGSEYELSVSFPAQPGVPYVIGASFGVRPGIDLGTAGYVPLVPDSLLAWSLSDPGTFVDFIGFLDQGGRGRGRWRIPANAGLRGIRIFFAAVAVTASNGISVSDPIGMTVR